MKPSHNIGDFVTFRDCAMKFLVSFIDIKIWLFTFVATPILTFTEKYLFADWQFLKWLALFMILDLITGIAKAWHNKQAITSYGFRRTVVKAVQYGTFLVVMHILDNFEVDGDKTEIFGWIVTGAYSFLMGVEGKSILENIVALDNRFDVKYFIEKIGEAFKRK